MTKYLVTLTLTVLRVLLWTPDKIFDIFLTSWNVWCLASGQSQRRKSFSSYAVVTKYLVTLTLTVLRVVLWTPDKIFDIFLTSWNVWCLASGLSQWKNLVTRQRNDKLISWETERVFWVNGMVAYQVKVKHREERLCTFLIKDITFAKLMQEMKRNCLPLAHLPSSNIRVR